MNTEITIPSECNHYDFDIPNKLYDDMKQNDVIIVPSQCPVCHRGMLTAILGVGSTRLLGAGTWDAILNLMERIPFTFRVLQTNRIDETGIHKIEIPHFITIMPEFQKWFDAVSKHESVRNHDYKVVLSTANDTDENTWKMIHEASN